MPFMQAHRSLRLTVCGLVLALATTASAGDFRLKIPKRSKPTPVQKLNQDGVKAVQKHDYNKAKRLFYKAYLLDPNDPFTLNNLGYIAELEGEIDRAQRYYALAAEQHSDAVVDRSTSEDMRGKPVNQVAGIAADQQMQINRMNVYAMGLLLKDRAPEADVTLQKALALDPRNPFTLNNLGFAKEKEGELDQALNFYAKAANAKSNEPVVVTVNSKWRGKPISEIAEENAEKVRDAMDRQEDVLTKVARLNLRGVSAINRNDRRLARQYFDQAYKLDESNAFTLNNMGYLAELDGDRETADFFYSRAREADGSDARVAIATRRELEGLRLGTVADSNGRAVAAATEADLEAKRREGGPALLRRRDNTPVVDPDRTPQPSSSAAPSANSGSTGGTTQDQRTPEQNQQPPQQLPR
ncbi:MAG TPA: tetratricopeptide repeat protein [Clostridia bacterium]|nr:tetratricopeptide repeat protein [Clostridia bacterium]